LGYVQSQTKSTGPTRVVSHIIFPKNLIFLFRRDSDTRILDGNDKFVFSILHLHERIDRYFTRFGILDGIRNQIGNDLPYPKTIAEYGNVGVDLVGSDIL